MYINIQNKKKHQRLLKVITIQLNKDRFFSTYVHI